MIGPPPGAAVLASSTCIVAIVADRRLSVAALSALLLRDPMWELVDEVRGIAAVRETIAAVKPDVVVLDTALAPSVILSRGAGVDGEEERRARTLILFDPNDAQARVVQAGHIPADGYLSQTASRHQFIEALTCLLASGGYVDPMLDGQLLSASRATQPTLSPRERGILVRIASGQSTKEVAREYAIAAKTVANHVNNISQKLNLRHRSQLVLYAAQQGLATF